MWAYGITKEQLNKVNLLEEKLRKPSMGIQRLNVPLPELKPGEVLVKMKSSALNFNTLWSAISKPLSSFQLIRKHVLRNPVDIDHIQDFAIFGSDGAGVIYAIAPDVTGWSIGDEVIIHCNVIDTNEPVAQLDGMLAESQSIWGYETNYGAFAEYAKVRCSQLISKPNHISWEVAASFSLTLSTAYRMLCSSNGVRIAPGDYCLIWGASGGLGSFAIQLIKLMGGIPVAVVSTAAKQKVCEELGCEIVINKEDLDVGSFVEADGAPDYVAWRRFKLALDKKGVKKVGHVFEHIGKNTLGLSIYLLEKGGSVVTCAATSGYLATIDLRFLWMNSKSIVGSHFANYNEAVLAAQLVFTNRVKPVLYANCPINELPEMADLMYAGGSYGKIVFKHE